ncbi:hypothetical protein ACHAXT_007698 [Thalassiosira profunda]
MAADGGEKGAPARIAVIGCGWWAQGWHLPHLAANPDIQIAAVVDPSPAPLSTLAASPLLPLPELAAKYNCKYFTSVAELLADPAVGPTIDGAIVATSHSSHFEVGAALLREGMARRQRAGGEGKRHRVMNVLMEKPMTTEVDEARRLFEMSAGQYPEGAFVINHTASYRPQTRVARHIVASNELGKIRHIACSMNGPLMWLFDDPKNHSWVSKTPWKGASSGDEKDAGADEKRPMSGNGYAWGQLAHVLAWIYAVLGAGDRATPDDDIAIPTKVYCTMSHAANTGADVSLAAVITNRDGVTFSLSGTALLPGSQYADPPVGKHIRVELFGEKGSLMYGGDDNVPGSGRLEVRRTAVGTKEDGQSEFPCSSRDWSGLLGEAASELEDGFYFEDGEQEGRGPGSMRAFLDACRGSSAQYSEGKEMPGIKAVDDSLIGLRTVQVIDAMYRSSISGKAEEIE